MRVVVAVDSIGAMSSARAGTAIAEGWPDAEVAVVPMGEAGRGFAQAVADQWGSDLVSGVLDDLIVNLTVGADALLVAPEPPSAQPSTGIDLHGSSVGLGRALRQALQNAATRPARILVDLTAARCHDGGAGLLAALGATADVPLDAGVAALGDLTRLDLDPVIELLGDAELIGVVPGDQTEQLLVGLRGITSLKGREAGDDPARLLATDASLERLARLARPEVLDLPGVGACGGTGMAIAALGGRILSGPAFTAELADLAATVRRADLVVTGCGVFDFAGRGGGVVAEAARQAGAALCPCIVVAGEVLIGGREMRTMGIESAYAVRDSAGDDPTGGDTTAAELAATSRRIARSWSW
ncbi:glycerate kinase [Microlunatus panaciterrae]|uniref:Glycerate kinase n=1 Tax=Microlunatus panaciterrae TaxID=400768 RepID=A0ABS2RQC0_9ACTN|nr:glycerate kinase [Microlunatus panaciterrae]MBM7800119.1 glycerate kinase [Microlunatus panaciterrae]